MALKTSKNHSPLVNTFEESVNLEELDAIRGKYASGKSSKKATPKSRQPAAIFIPQAGEAQPEELEAEKDRQRRFFYGAAKPERALDSVTLPVALHSLRDLSLSRFAFPLILNSADRANWATSLTACFDALLDGVEDSAKRADTLKTEFAVRQAIAGKDGADLGKILKDVTAKHDLPLPENVPDGKLFGYSADLYRQLFAFAQQARHEMCRADLKSELEQTIDNLERLLGGKSVKESPASESIPEAEIDLSAFEQIRRDTAKSTKLPKAREERLKEAMNILRGWLKKRLTSYSEEIFVNDLPDAITRQDELNGQFVAFIRARHLVRLELQGHYMPEKHDALFDEFNEAHVSDQEWTYRPCVMCLLDEKHLPDTQQLLQMADSGLPVKIVLRLDSLADDSGGRFTRTQGARLAAGMLMQPGIFSAQFPLAYAAQMGEAINEGLDFPGPALFALYGAFAEKAALPPYLVSAAAADARCFVPFVNNPFNGSGFANSFRLVNVPQQENVWPVNTFSVSDDEETRQEAFTAADFLSLLAKSRDAFMPLAGGQWHDAMQPFDLFSSATAGQRKLPYLQLVAEDGKLLRVLVDRNAATFAMQVQQEWQLLRELAGIENSHLQKQQQKWQQQAEQAVEEVRESLRREHEQEMQQALDKLTEDVIGKIASGLLAEDWTQVHQAPATTAPLPKKESQKTAQEEEPKQPSAVEEEDDEEIVITHDPYIDTPLCTSCNECRIINKEMFAYDDNQQAYIADAKAGTYRQLVEAAEKCPVRIIHPGKPLNEDESGLEDLIKRAEKFN